MSEAAGGHAIAFDGVRPGIGHQFFQFAKATIVAGSQSGHARRGIPVLQSDVVERPSILNPLVSRSWNSLLFFLPDLSKKKKRKKKPPKKSAERRRLSQVALFVWARPPIPLKAEPA